MSARLVISVGCPSGIGPEVSVRAARELDLDVVLVGDVDNLRAALDACALDDVDLALVPGPAEGFAHVAPAGRRVLRVWQPTRGLVRSARIFGEPTAAGGAAQLAWIDAALAAVREGHATAMVTGPASKSSIVAGGMLTFRGHTEYLADRLSCKHVTMAFATERCTTALVTTHLPLAKVPRAIDETKVARALVHLGAYLAARVDTRARIAVCGLNPHAGEGGLLGHEEQRIASGIAIAQAVFARDAVPVDVVGPLPAEAAFRAAHEGRYAGVLAMYHDQATIPTKLTGFGEAVNVSLGLPIVRTSVDHGTAYDQAGKGSADARGMVSALRLAATLSAPQAWPFADPKAFALPKRARRS